MRGFSTRRLSPMYLVRLPQLPHGEQRPADSPSAKPLPIGGNGLFETQFEARYALVGPLTLATFLDAGFVTTEHLTVRGASGWREQMLVAVGAGIRYRTPIGPIRLDLAYRPNIGQPLQVYPTDDPTLTYEASSGCFGFGRGNPFAGGSPEGPCSIHLSIGEAF